MSLGRLRVGTNFFDHPILKLQEMSRDLLNWVEEGLSSFSTADWVLVALAGTTLIWIAASLRAMTRLGPIEIETLEHDAGEEEGAPAVAVKALTGALRERLNDNGLSPPSAVPAGTPQVDLIAAVESTGAPQSAFIAKLLQLLPKPPRPPRYKITGVLLGEENPDGTDPPTEPSDLPAVATAGGFPEDGQVNGINGGPCGLTYWVQPSREGTARLRSVDGFARHSDAVAAAGFDIYQHVCNDAIHVFPVWARWRERESLEAYLEGCRPCPPNLPEEAVAQLATAVGSEPFNALAQLQRANLYEAYLPDDPGFDRAMAQSWVLRSYLRIASDWPTLVEARYRASVLAGALATTVDDPAAPSPLTPEQRGQIVVQLAFPGITGGNVAEQLRALAAQESKAVLQLLMPWYVLLRERRLRNQFEPKSHERRVTKRTVSISKHCVHMRALRRSRAYLTPFEIRRRSAAVHVRHMFFGRGSINWQAHYNASCFDGLLLQYLRDLRISANGLSDRRARRAERVRRRRAQWADRVQKRALKRLDTAFREAGPKQLSWNWVQRDPDFAVFTQPPLGDPFEDQVEWERLTGEIVERTPEATPMPPLTPPENDHAPISLPAPPWGKPRWRPWLQGAGIVTVLALTLVLGLTVGLWTSVVIVAAMCLVLIAWGWREQDLTS